MPPEIGGSHPGRVIVPDATAGCHTILHICLAVYGARVVSPFPLIYISDTKGWVLLCFSIRSGSNLLVLLRLRSASQVPYSNGL